MRDEELVSAILKGDEEAFEMLILKYEKPLFYMIKAMIQDTEEAKDILQKTFINVFKNLKKLKNKKQFKIWLYKIGLNLTRDYLKNKKEIVKLDCIEIIDNDSIENKVIHKDLIQKAKELIKLLPQRQREIVILRVFHEMSFNEISEILKISPESARTNFYFGINKLRKTLKREAIIYEM